VTLIGRRKCNCGGLPCINLQPRNRSDSRSKQWSRFRRNHREAFYPLAVTRLYGLLIAWRLESQHGEKTSEADREAALSRYLVHWLRRPLSWTRSNAAPIRIHSRGRLQYSSGFLLDMETFTGDVAHRASPVCLTGCVLGLLYRRYAGLE
jgi:hypothetical protein